LPACRAINHHAYTAFDTSSHGGTSFKDEDIRAERLPPKNGRLPQSTRMTRSLVF